eukprot:Blabericola_migrator_1__11018@NODE_639_length_7121_cov_24_942586_g470_i0_p3_GENE_NODE_639_length_7121_cov_24_942586_g470_i0NODE_639_length_7121_cov_24_942586_g470_i0_p3_ORF_typecomplete_len232_score13_80TMEM220/PF15071_6/0_2_NODE_639_length_7121_cov_24_942586_g470_i062606955
MLNGTPLPFTECFPSSQSWQSSGFVATLLNSVSSSPFQCSVTVIAAFETESPMMRAVISSYGQEMSRARLSLWIGNCTTPVSHRPLRFFPLSHETAFGLCADLVVRESKFICNKRRTPWVSQIVLNKSAPTVEYFLRQPSDSPHVFVLGGQVAISVVLQLNDLEDQCRVSAYGVIKVAELVSASTKLRPGFFIFVVKVVCNVISCLVSADPLIMCVQEGSLIIVPVNGKRG